MKTRYEGLGPKVEKVVWLGDDMLLVQDAFASGARLVRLLDGKPVYACHMLAMQADGADVLTVEGLAAADGPLHPVQQAFIDKDGYQCGFCTSGQMMSAKALLDRNPNPSHEEVRHALAGNLCRCGAYPKIIESVLAVSSKK